MSKRVTPSLVISIIALVVALGGVSYAAIKLPKNSVGAKQLKKNSVTAAKLKAASVTGAKIKNASIDSSKLGADAVDSSKVKDGTLTRGDFQAGQINGDAYFAQRDTSVPLTLTSSFQPVVTSPTLPPGFYVLNGRVNLLGKPTATSVICSMSFDAAQQFTVAANAVFPLAMSSVVHLIAPGTAKISCSSNANQPDIAQATIIATSVNSVTGLPESGG